jgi:hypothetical protein
MSCMAIDRHKNKLLGVRVTLEMEAVLRAYADRERRSVSQLAAILLEEVLTEKGLWPPAAEEAEEAPKRRKPKE